MCDRNNISGEDKFWGWVVTVISIAVCVLTFSAMSCTVKTTQIKADMVNHGADPVYVGQSFRQ
jgi:hypothetical protein